MELENPSIVLVRPPNSTLTASEEGDFAEKTSALEAYVRERSTQSTALLPGAPHERSGYDTGWKLHVNADVGAEP